jgi:hypothetical protein
MKNSSYLTAYEDRLLLPDNGKSARFRRVVYIKLAYHSGHVQRNILVKMQTFPQICRKKII